MTLALAIIGIVLAAASLGWQIWSHLSSGPRVQVETSNAIIPDAPKPDDWFVCITAINKGGSPTTVTNWGMRTPDGGNVHSLRPPFFSGTLPHRLEPQSHVDFHISVFEMTKACHERGIRVDSLRCWVKLSTGKTVMGPKPPVDVD